MADILDTPEQIERYRRLVIWQCVKTDVKFDGRLKLARNYRISAVKKEFGLKGDRHAVLAGLTKLLLADGTLTPCPNHADRPTHKPGSNLCEECWAQRGPRMVPRGT